MEILVQESDTRKVKQGEKLDSLIFNKKIYNQGPKVVVIGGGTGLNTVLQGLKQYTENITAIVTVSDYGASKESGANPLDNIKNSLIALSDNGQELSRLMNTKFENIDGEPDFSDIYFAAMGENYGNFAKSIEESSKVLNITGRVLPVTLDNVEICAELEDGTVVESKERIPEMVNEKVSKIDRVYLSPTNCKVAPGVIEAIREAEAIVIGPGSLYTNVIPNLLVAGVSRAIRESNAFKIYVGNIMTEFGQTDNFSLSDHLKTIIDHAGQGIVDYCIYDTGEIMPEYIRKYNKEGCELVEQDVNKVKDLGIKLIQRKLSIVDDGIIKHNPDAIATSIIQLICDDLKFNDMQNNAQFIMLDTKIKDTSKKVKKDLNNNIIRKGYKKNKKIKRNKSKFFTKYNERIESIRESENSFKKNRSKKLNSLKENSIKENNFKNDNVVIKEEPPRVIEKTKVENKPEFKTEERIEPKAEKIIEPVVEIKNEPKVENKIERPNSRHMSSYEVEKARTSSREIPRDNRRRTSRGKHSKQRGDNARDKDLRGIIDRMLK